MLAELAAANAAFKIIKETVNNGRELASAASAFGVFTTAKEDLERKVNKKGGGGKNNDLAEFMALERIKEQEALLREQMIWAGRPNMWADYQKFCAEARRKRREAEENRIKRRQRLVHAVVAGLAIAIVGAGVIAVLIALKATMR